MESASYGHVARGAICNGNGDYPQSIPTFNVTVRDVRSEPKNEQDICTAVARFIERDRDEEFTDPKYPDPRAPLRGQRGPETRLNTRLGEPTACSNE